MLEEQHEELKILSEDNKAYKDHNRHLGIELESHMNSSKSKINELNKKLEEMKESHEK